MARKMGEMGEMGVAHIQMVIIMQTGVDRDTELHKAIQIVLTTFRW